MMQERNDNAPSVPPAAAAIQLVQGVMGGKLIAALTAAGVPDALGDAARPLAEIAQATGLHPDALARALRGAEMLGVFARTPDGAWRNTAIGRALRGDVPGSVRDYVVYALHDGSWRAWQHLGDTLRSGAPSFALANDGLGFWEYLDAHEPVAEAFHRGMAALSAGTPGALPQALELGRFARLADIGGGSGAVLASLLEAAPALAGILFDSPAAIEAARARFAQRGLLDRVQLACGDFFERVPEGADAYLLKNILHDHDDGRCARILDVVRSAMPAHARLFIVDAVLPERGPHPAIWRDLHMLVALGGRERTEAEWRALLAAHGFTIDRIGAPSAPNAVIESRLMHS